MSRKFDPFKPQNLFYEYELNITKEEINQILILVKDVNSLDCKTTYKNLNVLNFPTLKNLRKQITDILNKHSVLLSNNWAQLYNTEHEHSVHVHPGSVYSGIIYIKGINPSPTIFYGKLFKQYRHEFKDNTLLLVPSDIPHEVRPLIKNEERLIVSFNTIENNDIK